METPAGVSAGPSARFARDDNGFQELGKTAVLYHGSRLRFPHGRGTSPGHAGSDVAATYIKNQNSAIRSWNTGAPLVTITQIR